MVTTKKWIRKATATGGRLLTPLRPQPAVVLTGLLCLSLAMVFVGCGKPPGDRELTEGIRLLDAGRPSEAIPVFERASELLVTNQLARANALNYLGLAYHRAGQTDAANQAYQAALNEDLNLLAARYNRGCLLLELGKLDEATQELTTFVDLRPAPAEGWLRLGSAHLRAGHVQEAAAAFKEAGERAISNPTKVQALNGAGVCLVHEGRLADAGLFFDAAFKLDPKYPPVLLNQAILAERTKDTWGALSKYTVWLETAGDAAARTDVEAHLKQLAQALQPALASGDGATQEQLARMSNLFTRVGSMGDVASAPVATNPPATTVVVASNPPPDTLVVASNPPPVTVTPSNPPPVVMVANVRSNPPPVTVTTSPPPITIVSALPSHRPTIDTSAPPAITVALSPPSAVTTPSASGLRNEAPSGTRPTPPTTVATPAGRDEGTATGDVAMVEENLPSRPELAMAAPVPVSPREAIEPETTAPADLDESPPTEEQAGGAEPAEKRSFLSKINPLNLFRREPREKRVTPLPPRRTERTTESLESPGETTGIQPPGPEAPVAVVRVNPPEPEPQPAEPEPARPAYVRYSYLSPALPETGDPEKAARLLEAAAQAHQEGRYADAAEGYRKAIKSDPACYGARYNLATLELDRLRPEAALPEFESALVISPHEPAARFNFALALESAGYPLDAALEMERSLADKPDNAAAHLMLGGLYANTLGDIPRAREHFARVLAIEPNHPQADRIRRWLSAHR
ncbi:MAG: tetratricopeptide repeat protein [Verrucomicrobiales bacterium]|nr:tetratricopeptide repeat protein [Verrucomicrobiales bacterium]